MCDTFVALSSATRDGSVIFGKNSDREPNEAQALEYYPGKITTPRPQNRVNCTYISVPQARETLSVIICRPFWMWGAEMGANEKGVVIGNEAVFTRMPHKKAAALTGMDILRLALERSSTAEQGVEAIVQLLSDHGQGGVCGFQDQKLFYHNSFIVADPNEAWVMETAGHLWAALKIKNRYSISNGLTIGEEFDRHHPDLINTAQEKKWLKKTRVFNFAECYSDWFYTTFSACRSRQKRSFSMLNKLDIPGAFSMLRAHGKTPYRPDAHLFMNTICMHAGNGLSRNSGTTGSLVAHLGKKSRTFWATGTAAPCTGIFKPIRFTGEVLPDTGPSPLDRFNPDSMWWHHEKLHRSIIKDYPSGIDMIKKERDIMESSFIHASKTNDDFSLTKEAFLNAKSATHRWIEQVNAEPQKKRTRTIFRQYWKKQNRNCGLQGSWT
jgi:secernin